jgi:hypothetical protein
MTEITLDAGTLTASAADRTCTGLLVPFGEDGRSNLGRFRISSGAFSLPADPAVAGLNDEHIREQPIGRATELHETQQGIVATFSIARTPEGDRALADIAAGRRRYLSAEVADVQIRAGQAVGGRVFGAALVARPAFPSATLLAAAADTDGGASEGVPGEDPDTEQTEYETSETADDGSIVNTRTTVTEEIEELEDGSEQLTRTTVAVTTITPATDGTDNEGQAPVPNTTPAAAAATTAPAAAVPPTMLATTRSRQRAGMDARTLYATLAQATVTREPTLLAALSDVTISGAGSVGSNVLPPQWLGELWNHRVYQRRYVDLWGHADLTGFDITGWRWTTKPEMALWTGNKSAVPSNTVETEPYINHPQRIAGAHDIGREFRDFNVPEFWDSYFRTMTESYAKLSDTYVLDQATAEDAFTPVAGSQVPANVTACASKIVDGVLAIIDHDLPSFAIVGKADYRDLLLTRQQDVLEYLNAALGYNEGTIKDFKIVATPHPAFQDGSVMVGAASSAYVHELPGSPIRVETLDMTKGGIDPGLFGYTAFTSQAPEALTMVRPYAAG